MASVVAFGGASVATADIELSHESQTGISLSANPIGQAWGKTPLHSSLELDKELTPRDAFGWEFNFNGDVPVWAKVIMGLSIAEIVVGALGFIAPAVHSFLSR